ncbi:hypothetical protein BDV93DRAFT_87302 [Ceratobasidium sp. AG-I]|nr:hypothetical protein BDV93DRAFT_87302 [Ceratobasidium sp. AG-I]
MGLETFAALVHVPARGLPRARGAGGTGLETRVQEMAQGGMGGKTNMIGRGGIGMTIGRLLVDFETTIGVGLGLETETSLVSLLPSEKTLDGGGRGRLRELTAGSRTGMDAGALVLVGVAEEGVGGRRCLGLGRRARTSLGGTLGVRRLILLLAKIPKRTGLSKRRMGTRSGRMLR